MAVDMWYMAAVMTMVVDGSGDEDGGIWQRLMTMVVYCSGDDDDAAAA